MVRCIDCGFLAVRDLRSRQLVEMEQGYRITGESPQVIDFSPHFNIYDEPRCFVRAHDLREEIKKDIRRCSSQEKTLPVINLDRDCKSFTEWKQGFTPKEHQEMIDRKAMLEWQAAREREDREFREWEHRSNTSFRLIELGLVVLTIIAMFVAAFISRGGEPIINITTPNPSGVTIEKQP